MPAHRRCGPFSPLPLGALLLGLLLGGVTLFAEPTSRGGVRQKPGKKAPPKKRSEDEDDDPKPVKRKILDVDGPDDKAAARRPAADLTTLAREAKDARVAALYANLAVPHDEVTLKGSAILKSGEKSAGGVFRIAPLRQYVRDVKDLKEKLTLQFIDKVGKPTKTDTPGLREILAIRHYEQLAIEDVRNFLQSGGDDSLSPIERLLAAEQTLAAVLRFHESAREQRTRQGDWRPVEDALRGELLGVLVRQLNALAENKSWDAAFELTRRLTDTHSRPQEVALYAPALASLLQKALDDPQFSQERLRDARRRLRQIQQRFPDLKALQPLSDKLRDQAQALYATAQDLVKKEKRAEALRLLKQAAEVWPELPGLRAYRMRIDSEYQILRVNQAQLPRLLSPGRAVVDAERRVVDLLFESLVGLAPNGAGLMTYHAALAEGRFKVVENGREFRLPRHARWSDGKPLRAADVRFTVNRLRGSDGATGWRDAATGRPSAWGELLKDVKVSDPFRVRLELEKGMLDPLAAMSFPLVPYGSRPDSEAFALRPVGSGPFVLGKQGSEESRPFVRLVPNDHYGARRDKEHMPRLREVHLCDFPDPVAALKAEKVDIAFDLTAAQAAALQADPDFVVAVPEEKRPRLDRRIYFLAVNNRRQGLSDDGLRVALALAINRERLLDEHFRKGLGRRVHLALNGPYPAQSWACNPRLGKRDDSASVDPFDPDLARSKAKQALTRLRLTALPLKLKYPTGDKALAAAMTELCAEVSRTLEGVTLTAEGRSPEDLRRDVEQANDYDLAYYCYDFPDESLWLQPLLGSGRGGAENYLGYNGRLVPLIQKAAMLRNLVQIKEQTREIHRRFLQIDMPFVPLWQLDALYAYRKGRIDLPPLEPHRPFARGELWRVTNK